MLGVRVEILTGTASYNPVNDYVGLFNTCSTHSRGQGCNIELASAQLQPSIMHVRVRASLAGRIHHVIPCLGLDITTTHAVN